MSMNRCSQCPGKADAKYLSEHKGFCPVCWDALIPGLQREKEKPKDPILVIVEGGLVQGITNIPPNVTVEVRDYNTGDAKKEDLIQDEDGSYYYSTVVDSQDERMTHDDS